MQDCCESVTIHKFLVRAAADKAGRRPEVKKLTLAQDNYAAWDVASSSSQVAASFTAPRYFQPSPGQRGAAYSLACYTHNAPGSSKTMTALHPLVTRFISLLPSTPPASGLALPPAQISARNALRAGRPRCWTTTLFPPMLPHDPTCTCQHLRLWDPVLSGGRRTLRARKCVFDVSKDVAEGWDAPRCVDVNALMGTNLGELHAECVFVLAALKLAYSWDDPRHFTLWGSTTAVTTAKRVQSFVDNTLSLLFELPIAWMGLTNTLWFIHGQHVKRFASEMPYLNRPEVPAESNVRVTRQAARTPPAFAHTQPSEGAARKPLPARRPPPTEWDDVSAPLHNFARPVSDYAYGRCEETDAADAEINALKLLCSTNRAAAEFDLLPAVAPSSCLRTPTTVGRSPKTRRKTSKGRKTRTTAKNRSADAPATGSLTPFPPPSPTLTPLAGSPERDMSEETCVPLALDVLQLGRSTSEETCVAAHPPSDDMTKPADDPVDVVPLLGMDVSYEEHVGARTRSKRKREEEEASLAQSASKRARTPSAKAVDAEHGDAAKPVRKMPSRRAAKRT